MPQCCLSHFWSTGSLHDLADHILDPRVKFHCILCSRCRVAHDQHRERLRKTPQARILSIHIRQVSLLGLWARQMGPGMGVLGLIAAVSVPARRRYRGVEADGKAAADRQLSVH